MIEAEKALDQLQALKNAAVNDWQSEERFLTALLKATVYAHVPKKLPPAGRLQFVQFNRTDNGEVSLPIFIDRKDAEKASGGMVGIVAMEGRRLLELTRGATLLLDPLGIAMTLYPPEVNAILAGQALVGISRETISERETVAIGLPSVPVDHLIEALAASFADAPDVEAAYLCEMRRGADFDDVSLLVEIVVPDNRAQRIVQSSAQALQSALSTILLPIDICCLPTTDELKEALDIRVPIYSRNR